MKKADYGLDAPGVVRNLALASLAGFVIYFSAAAGFWSGAVKIGPVTFVINGMGLAAGIFCGIQALYMIWGSKVGKLRERDSLLANHAWTGMEKTLDVGCGRGLLLIGAAKRGASAIGLDLWQGVDLSGNKPEATLENARRESVLEKVKVQTGNMMQMPFADGEFDVVVSMTAIHNIYNKEGRAKALAEIARVTKPGGAILIDDIAHLQDYAAGLRAAGMREVRELSGGFGGTFFMLMTFGAMRPARVVAKK